ncbi:MAG: hypothetical protein WC608_00930 [Parcubacteria group bacterium]
MLAKSGIGLRINGDRIVVGGGGVVDVPVDDKKDESVDELPKESFPGGSEVNEEL